MVEASPEPPRRGREESVWTERGDDTAHAHARTYCKGLNAETPALRREHQSLVGSSSTLSGRPPRLGIVG
ncbi:hypothetical protein J6590_034388 [Homalodisca vitripennis]|nr:hypothetical protein J6590_034388 [Homalodisca vitripennis]